MNPRILRAAFASAIIFVASAENSFAAMAATASQPAATASARILSEAQRDIIKHRVLREAKVSIVPLGHGEPQQFADQLVTALKDAGAWVAVGTSDPGEPVEPGLVVIYDHSVPADASIFLALDRAGLKPVDRDIPGAPVATIMVGPAAAP
jgi:hypothetical protein